MFFDSLSKLGKMYNCIANFAYGSLQDFSLTQICVLRLFFALFDIAGRRGQSSTGSIEEGFI